MQVLIAVSCLLAVASAGYVHSAYNYPLVHAQHVPVIGPHGVPQDEPAVAHAKAEHAAAHAQAHARNGDGYGYAAHEAAPVAYASHYGHYTGPQHIPVINHLGVPVDTPAVQAARAHHAAAFNKAQARNGDVYENTHDASYGYAAHSAVPLDTPEVAHAKAAHFAAHAEANARNSVYHYAPSVHYRKRRGIYEYAAPVVAYGGHYAGAQHVPVIGAHGVPLDEPVVAHAKAEHAAAYAKIAATHAHYHVAGPVVSYAGHLAGPVAYAGHYAGPQHIPVINHKGVPVDEPAVQAARAHHAATFAEVQARDGHTAEHYAVAGPVAYAGHYGYAGPQHIPIIGHNGVPIDEPAVAHARAEHAAAHAKAAARNGGAHYAHPVAHSW